MLTRISLIVAIVAGLAVAGLNFVKVKEKITTLMSQLASETQAKQEAQADAAATKKTLAVTKTELESTKTELASTQEARDKAVAEKEAQTKRATKLAQDLSKSQQERGDLQAQLAQWSALGLTADQIRPLQNDLKKVRENLTALTETNRLAGIVSGGVPGQCSARPLILIGPTARAILATFRPTPDEVKRGSSNTNGGRSPRKTL